MDRSSAIGQLGHLESSARWYQRLSRPKASGELSGAILRCFDGIGPTIEQPALNENIIAIHLGGAKRVNRWQGPAHQTWDVPSQAITLMPAYRANRWHTEGVVAFAHLTLSHSLMARLARDEFDRDPGEIVLLDRAGIVDPLLSELMLALGREIAKPGLRRVYRDSLLATLGITVLRRHSTLVQGTGYAQAGGKAQGGLAGWQLHDCFGKCHELTFKASLPPHGPPTFPGPNGTDFEVIIIRHGLENAPKPPLQRTRHMLPYHRP